VPRRILFAAIVFFVAAYYWWAAQASGTSFVWNQDLGGYYDLAARGFAAGHLYVPISPPQELLALPNPWDPASNARYRLHDAVLFNRRYYLLHLPGPAIALFLPWRLITGHDLPENFALWVFCVGGFAFSTAALLRLIESARATPPAWMLALMTAALGFCQGAPYLMSSVRMYEVAIGGGYFFVSAGIYAFVRATTSSSIGWRFTAGAMFASAMACRPHLAIAALAAFIALAIFAPRRFAGAVAFAAPVLAVSALLAAYNYARFGDIFEFGARYQLANIPDSSIHLAASNIPPGVYYFLFCSPDFSAVFPWARPVLRFPFNSTSWALPPRYFLEPTGGALWIAPFALAIFLLPRARAARAVPTTLLASALAVVLFLAATGFTTQRYEADVLPLLVWAALAAFAIASPGRAIHAVMAVLIVCGIVIGLALGISGPRDEMLNQHPEEYVRLAALLSPIAEYRPILNPEFSASFTAEFKPQREHYREPLVTLGRQAYRYYLYAEQVAGKVRIASYRENSEMDCLVDATRPIEFALRYDAASHTMYVAIDGVERLTHPLGNLLTAPADVSIGENRIDPNITEPRFTGRISVASIRGVASTAR
jgi:hypothetical protein